MTLPPPELRPGPLTPPPTHPMAVLSLVFGILTWTLLPFLGAIVAIVLGHVARSDFRRNPGAQNGDGMAVAGLVMGYAQLVLTVIGFGVVMLVLGGLAHSAHH